MANEFDELTGPVNQEGRDINVIEKQLKMEVGTGSLVFEIFLWVLFIIPGIIFTIKKIQARNYLASLQQRINGAASELDSIIEQKVIILSDVVNLVNRSVDLDKSTFIEIAKVRSGNKFDDIQRNEIQSQLDINQRNINLAFENYPELKSQDTIMNAMQQNSYLQREITAGRTNYNDLVTTWNSKVNQWPTYKIVAAKNGYTTRIPFSTSSEVKQRARETFF
ncbi:LemA family protein [[Acholeplasma] multilocale]|uniref:LemA family protein n=1 Tax=[Acholeplasma] multilocale TaxID=264638 RepID=UPI00047DCB60|nr:LemA family protein [[Acholeplasma] multilocale]